MTQVEPCRQGDGGPPCPLPTRGGPSPAPDASCPQPTPRPVVLSDGCGWETPCRGGAAPSTQRWRQAGDEDVTRHSCGDGASSPPRWRGGPGGEHGSAGARAGPPQPPGSRTAPSLTWPALGAQPRTASSLVPTRGHTLWTWQCRHLGREQSRARPGVLSTHTRSQHPGAQPQHPSCFLGAATSISTPALLLSPHHSTQPWPHQQHLNLSLPLQHLQRHRPALASPTALALSVPHRFLHVQIWDPFPRHPTDTPPPLPPSSGVHKARASALCMDGGFVLQSEGGSPTPHHVPTEPPHRISHPAEPPPHSPFQGSPHSIPHRAPTPEPPAAPRYGGTGSPPGTSKPEKGPDTEWRSRPEPAGTPRAPPGAAGPCPVPRWSRRWPRLPPAASAGPDGAGRGPGAAGTCGAHGLRHPRPVSVSAPTRAAPAAPHCPDGTRERPVPRESPEPSIAAGSRQQPSRSLT